MTELPMRQLVFASVPSGLAPGRSGYCTVARSADLGERLARELEAAGAHEPGEGVAYAFRLVRTAGETCAVLTRYTDAGPDYTGRASTLAHHLVFSPGEIASLPPPADIARRFTGWTNRWVGPPRVIDDAPAALSGKPVALPAAEWKRVTGDAGKAALFCDDAGRAKPGVIPVPDGADALALIAEASLLLEDKGWTTPFTTRVREPDADSLWRTSPGADARTLPEPGLARRATLARAGVMAGARPKAAQALRAKNTPAYGKGEQDDLSGTSDRRRTTIILIGAVVALAAISAAVITLINTGEPAGNTPPERPADPPPSVTPDVRPPHPLSTEAIGALKAGDLTAAARAWLALNDAAPGEALALRADILPPIRERLMSDSLAHLSASVAGATGLPDAAARLRIREAMTELRSLATRTGTQITQNHEAQFASLKSVIDAMERADSALPACRIVMPRWTTSGDTALATTDITDLGDAPEMAKFLSAPHTRLTISVAPFTGFGEPATPSFTQEVAPKDFSPGKALAIVHPELNRLIGFELDSRKRLTLTRRTPKSASPSALPLPGGRTVMLSLTDSDTGERASLLLIAESNPPRPLSLPENLLKESDGVVAPPAWLATLTSRVSAPGASPALLPDGYNGTPRDFAGLTAPRAIVEQALRARLVALRASPSGTRDTRTVETALAELPRNLREAGSPWSICIAPPGPGITLTLIQFAKP